MIGVVPLCLSLQKSYSSQDGKTALSWAARFGRTDCVRLLLKSEIDINAKTKGVRFLILRIYIPILVLVHIRMNLFCIHRTHDDSLSSVSLLFYACLHRVMWHKYAERSLEKPL